MISRSEWHPFSIIQVPGKESRAAFYAEAVSGKSTTSIRKSQFKTPVCGFEFYVFGGQISRQYSDVPAYVDRGN